jgi:hypothetical protein
MADVTRKTGPNPDINPSEPGATTSNQPAWLIAICSPGGFAYGSGFCAYFGF